MFFATSGQAEYLGKKALDMQSELASHALTKEYKKIQRKYMKASKDLKSSQTVITDLERQLAEIRGVGMSEAQ